MQEQQKQSSDCHPEHSKPENWYLYSFYYAPKDPNVFVAKRWGWKWGATVNFARPGAYVVLGVPMVIGLVVAVCACIYGH